MDGGEDPSKLASTLHEPTTTQPLLSHQFPSLEPSAASISETEEDQAQYLQISYNYGPRSFKDLPFLILFWVLVLCTFGFGIFAAVNRNPHRYQVSSFVYNTSLSSFTIQDFGSPFSLNSTDWNLLSSAFGNNPTSLNASKSNVSESVHGNSPAFYNSASSTPQESSLLYSLMDYLSLCSNPTSLNSLGSSVLNSLIWTLVITLILSLPFVLLVLLLLKRYTKQIVYASLPFFVIVPIFVNVYWFVACTVSSRCSGAFPLSYRILVLIFVLLIIGVIVWIFIVNWHRVELTVNIIGVAANALSSYLGLFGVLLSLTLGLFVYYVPIVFFLIYSSRNGKIVPEEENGAYICVWKQDRWVPAYYTLAILTMLWSAAAMVEAQVYVISGTIAQWYFSKDELRPKRAIRSSLRNAFSHSSGTICFSGLIFSAVRVVRSMVDNARQEETSGIVNVILRCCVSALMSVIDFLNKFTINFAAITGEAYCKAARITYKLLKRNLLSAVFVETVSTRILAGIILVLSAIYTILLPFVGYALRAVFMDGEEKYICSDLKFPPPYFVLSISPAGIRLGDDAYFVAVMAWILLIVILGYFVHVLDNVIDTVYVFYAIDWDRGEVSKQEVHDVYVHLPISRSHRPGFPVRAPLVV